jgi:hypothetical protein
MIRRWESFDEIAEHLWNIKGIQAGTIVVLADVLDDPAARPDWYKLCQEFRTTLGQVKIRYIRNRDELDEFAARTPILPTESQLREFRATANQ